MKRPAKTKTGGLLKKYVSKKKMQDDVVASVKNFKFKKDIPGISQPGKSKSSNRRTEVGQLVRKVAGKNPEAAGRLKKNGLKAVFLLGFLAICGVGVKLSGVDQIIVHAVAGIEYFHLKKIEITGCRVTDKSTLRKQAKLDYNTSLLTLDKEVVVSLIENDPWIASSRIEIKWPDGIEVLIREHAPEAIISLGNQERQSLYYMSNRGLPFTRVTSDDELDFPVITGLSSIEELEQNPDIKKDIFTFIKQAKRNNPRFPIQGLSEIHITPEKELVVYMVEHPFPIYMGKGEMKSKYRQLLSVLEVLYRKHSKGAKIARVESIRMDYYGDRALVSLDE